MHLIKGLKIRSREATSLRRAATSWYSRVADDCNLLFRLIVQEVFGAFKTFLKISGWGNCPVSPLVAGLTSHLVDNGFRFTLRSLCLSSKQLYNFLQCLAEFVYHALPFVRLTTKRKFAYRRRCKRGCNAPIAPPAPQPRSRGVGSQQCVTDRRVPRRLSRSHRLKVGLCVCCEVSVIISN